MQSPVLTVVVAILLIMGAVVAIPVMNRRRYGPRSANKQRQAPQGQSRDDTER